jgi:hypothetical protein
MLIDAPGVNTRLAENSCLEGNIDIVASWQHKFDELKSAGFEGRISLVSAVDPRGRVVANCQPQLWHESGRA